MRVRFEKVISHPSPSRNPPHHLHLHHQHHPHPHPPFSSIFFFPPNLSSPSPTLMFIYSTYSLSAAPHRLMGWQDLVCLLAHSLTREPTLDPCSPVIGGLGEGGGRYGPQWRDDVSSSGGRGVQSGRWWVVVVVGGGGVEAEGDLPAVNYLPKGLTRASTS